MAFHSLLSSYEAPTYDLRYLGGALGWDCADDEAEAGYPRALIRNISQAIPPAADIRIPRMLSQCRMDACQLA